VNEKRRAWVLPLAIFAAMLIVPLFVWLFLPNHTLPPRKPRQKETSAAVLPPEAPLPSSPVAPSPRPALRPSEPKADEPPKDDGVVGMVVDPDGQPMPRAFVGCDDRSTFLTASTDDEGRFRLPAEASGCLVIAQHKLFPPSDRVLVEAGKENVIRLSAGGSIEGIVVDESGAAVPTYRLSIELFLPKSEGVDLGVRGRPMQVEDAAGAYRWERLPAGKYILAASVSGRPPGKSDTVDVDTGQTTRNVRIVLPRGATLSGTVLDEETRRPIAGAIVRLDGMMGGGAPDPVAPSTTDGQGAFSLVGVPPGLFSVRVERDGYKSRIVSGLSARGLSTAREDITLRPRGDGGSASELEGIGAILAPSPAGIVIASLVEAGPAAKAGLRRGDRISRIDGVSASEMTIPDAIQRLRGAEGSRVSVSIVREGETNLDVTILRERIER